MMTSYTFRGESLKACLIFLVALVLVVGQPSVGFGSRPEVHCGPESTGDPTGGNRGEQVEPYGGGYVYSGGPVPRQGGIPAVRTSFTVIPLHRVFLPGWLFPQLGFLPSDFTEINRPRLGQKHWEQR